MNDLNEQRRLAGLPEFSEAVGTPLTRSQREEVLRRAIDKAYKSLGQIRNVSSSSGVSQHIVDLGIDFSDILYHLSAFAHAQKKVDRVVKFLKSFQPVKKDEVIGLKKEDKE